MTTSNAPGSAVPSRGAHDVHRLPHPERPKWIDGLARFGLVIRGIIYFVPGVFALRWSLGRQREPMSQSSAIELVGHQPLGRVLLVAVAIGLAGYAAWGLIRAFSDPQRRGHTLPGIAQRIGYAMSAIAYLGMLLATIRLLTRDPGQAGLKQDWITRLLAHPFGGIVVAGVGMCWIFGSGIAQIVMGWRKSFESDLMVERMSDVERRWAIGLGRVGLVSRGFVFTLIGVLIVAAALHVRPQSSSGLEGALLELASQTFGRTLLGAAGIGLMAFGLYSASCARWMRMRRAPDSAGPILHEVHRKSSP
jgi:hypothetical protein